MPTARIIIIVLSAALSLAMVAVGLLFTLHSGLWPTLEPRLHPEAARISADLAQRITTLEQQLSTQDTRKTRSPTPSSGDIDPRQRLLAVRHHLLEAREYARFSQTQQMRLALHLARLHLEQTRNESATAPVKSLLDQKLSQLSTRSDTAAKPILERLARLTERLNTAPPQNLPPADAVKTISFWEQPTAFIARRLMQSVHIRHRDQDTAAADPRTAGRALGLVKNAVLAQDAESYRLALENAKLMLHANSRADTILKALNQLPATLPTAALPELDDLLDLLQKSIDSPETDA